MNDLLSVQNLSLSISKNGEKFFPVRDVSFSINPSEIIGIIGESASGKTLTTQAILQLLTPNIALESGRILFQNDDILQKNEKEMTAIRGKEIAYIPQNPHSSLNPTQKIGSQITEVLMRHLKVAKKESIALGIQALEKVKIPYPEKCFYLYPHELSGGMKQRVIIAMALALKPKIIIADEPTTALDVTLQKEILHLLKMVHIEHKIGILFITHDMAVASHLCDKILVMYAGEIIERGLTKDIINTPKHPYTKMLLEAVPTLDKDKYHNPLRVTAGTVPQLKQTHTICPFIDRCPKSMLICTKQKPLTFNQKSKVNCWLYDERNTTNRDQKPQKKLPEKEVAGSR
ncbi:MAG: peptide ABC transporter ATP-binding protein [Chlamydiae bacterium CG10_big_fil_rev_8_21_14_0_10_35_9]|nr:MAG: peptide ABC transporter ATP-binding protein [Chlamydiae bacterium CG10_big_fil_rev_8_21_14_0_10_35_9]